MIIRRMTKKDRKQYDDLCRHAFGMSVEQSGTFLDLVWRSNRIFGAFDGTKLAAGLWYYAFEMRVGEGYIPMAGVSAVATWPEYRKLGLAKQLMIEGQKHMKRNGCPTSTLIPFKFSFYGRMGYAQALDVQVCEFDPARIRGFPDEGYRVEETNARHWRELEQVHLAFGQRFHGTVKRNMSYWKHEILRHESGMSRRAYMIYKGKTPRGQIIITMKEVRDLTDAAMTAVFLSWTDPGAGRAIFRFLKSHSDQFKTVKVFLPPDIRIHQYFERPQITAKLEPKMMFKLVDAAAAVEQRSYPGLTAGKVIIDLEGDPTAPWNTGHYDVAFTRGRARMIRRTSRRKPTGVVHLSIQALSQLYLGYYSVEELREMVRLSGPQQSLTLLGRAFPKSPTYIEDWY